MDTYRLKVENMTPREWVEEIDRVVKSAQDYKKLNQDGADLGPVRKKLRMCRKFLEDLAKSNTYHVNHYFYAPDDSKVIQQFLDTLDQETEES